MTTDNNVQDNKSVMLSWVYAEFFEEVSLAR